jgi:phosphonoacetaldehyde hydrolase
VNSIQEQGMTLVCNRRYQGSLKGVLLDWAGTTIDYGCYAPTVAFIEVFKRKGVGITIEEAREPMGAGKKVHLRSILEIPAVAGRWKEINGRASTDDDVEAMYQAFIPLQLDCLADYAELIPGTLETVAAICEQGMKIGSTTGYTGEMMVLLLAEAKKRGYEPDSTVCATDVPEARPASWMCLRNAENLSISPLESMVKVGDTQPDIAEGLNAGMWTIGLAKTGNEIGLNEPEINALTDAQRQKHLDRAYQRLRQAGAHYVVDSIAQVLPVLNEINPRLAQGERP